MAKRWRVGHDWWHNTKHYANVLEGEPESGARYVCEALVEDAERIASDHNAMIDDQEWGPDSAAERLERGPR